MRKYAVQMETNNKEEGPRCYIFKADKRETK